MNMLKENNFGILLLLFPLSFVIGIAVTEVFCFFIILLFLILNKDKSLFFDYKILFLILFSFFVSLNALIQIEDDLKYSSFVYSRFILFSLSIFYICNIYENYKNTKHFLFIIIPIIVIIFDAFYQLFFGVNILGFELQKERVSSFFNDELILGSFLIRILPIILWFIFFLKINLNKYFYFFVIFFASYFITIYLSGERTSLGLCVILIFLVIIFIKPIKSVFLNSFYLLMIFVVLSFFINFGNINLANRIFIKSVYQFTSHQLVKKSQVKKTISQKENLKKISKNFKLFSSDHHGHITLAISLFKENKLFGVGPKGFRHYCRTVKYEPDIGICTTHPHNFLAQILSELGLLGFIFYIIAVFFVVINLYKTFRKNIHNENTFSFYAVSFGLIINFFPFLPSGNFFNNWISIMIYYNIGFYLFSCKKQNF